jgi:hypothetical protein
MFTFPLPLYFVWHIMKPRTNTLHSFAAFGIFTITTTYFFIPDYTGRSHAQIDELFSRRIPARKVRRIIEEYLGI